MARATVTQAEITRAIKAAKAAGMPVGRVEVSRDGAIVITVGAAVDSADAALEAWERSHGAR